MPPILKINFSKGRIWWNSAGFCSSGPLFVVLCALCVLCGYKARPTFGPSRGSAAGCFSFMLILILIFAVLPFIGCWECFVENIVFPEPSRIQRRDLARTRKPFLPLLGERAGVRADFFTLISLFGFMVRGIFFFEARFLQSMLGVESYWRPELRLIARPGFGR
jgi:hypothetical protein